MSSNEDLNADHYSILRVLKNESSDKSKRDLLNNNLIMYTPEILRIFSETGILDSDPVAIKKGLEAKDWRFLKEAMEAKKAEGWIWTSPAQSTDLESEDDDTPLKTSYSVRIVSSHVVYFAIVAFKYFLAE